MTDPENAPPSRHSGTSLAGGFFIFLGLLAGSIIGISFDQPSAGMVGGLAAGALIATVIWLRDRRRK